MNDDFVYTNLNSILEITNVTDSALDNDVIESCIHSLNNILEYAAKPYEKKRPSKNPDPFSTTHKVNNPWYDSECKNKRKEFDAARLIYYNTLHKNDLTTMCNIRNEY